MRRSREMTKSAPECAVQYSQIRVIAEKVTEKNKKLPEDEQVINLALGQNFIGNPQPVFEKIPWFKQGEFKTPILYEPSLGTAETREQIGTAFYPSLYDIPEDYYSPQDIMITDGAFGAGRNALAAIMSKGDILVVDRFTFRYFINTLQIFGRGTNGVAPSVRVAPSTKEDHFVTPPEKMKRFLQNLKDEHPGKKIVYYTQFGFNPTGNFRNEAELRDVAQFIGSEPRLFLINDIAYHLIRWDDKMDIPLATYLTEETEGIIDIDTLSKPFGLMGARVGCMLTKDRELFKASARVQQYSIVSPSKFTVDIWQAVSKHISTLLDVVHTLNQKLRERKQLMREAVELAGVSSFPSSGGLYSFLRVPGDASELWQPLIEKAKVAGVPGTAFADTDDSVGNRYIRFTIAFPKETIRKAATRIARFFTD